jgi:hypothetical protein
MIQSKSCRFVRHWLAIALSAIGVTAATAQAKVHVKIAASPQAVESFTKWNAQTPWEQIARYDGPNANRPTVDLLLELQALKAGGLDFDFEFVPVPNYERAKLEVVQGGADLSAETLWDDEIAENSGTLLKTDAVIRKGEFEKGIYVVPTNDRLLKMSSLDEFRTTAAAVVGTWALDVKTLEAMKLKGIEKAGKPENVFLMIDKGRADFTLMEFSSAADLATETSGVKLVPVPNCKVGLLGSRSWVVSKASASASSIHEALVRGAKVMRGDGRIERAYRESGFLNARVATWKRIF